MGENKLVILLFSQFNTQAYFKFTFLFIFIPKVENYSEIGIINHYKSEILQIIYLKLHV